MIINNLGIKGENIDKHTSGATYISEGVANSNQNNIIIS
jgi:hypothetical protein